MTARFAVLPLSALLLTACATAPQPEDVATPAGAAGDFASAERYPEPFDPAAPQEAWWRLFDSAALDGLIGDALEHNNDIAAAAANLRQARAALGQAQAALWPDTQASASAAYGRPSAQAQGVSGPLDEDVLYDAGLGVSYEVDLFGRVRSSVEAARADAGAAEAAMHAVRIAVAAETARAFADACSANAQIAVAERSIGVQRETLDLTRRIESAGRGTPLDVSRAEAALETTRATLPDLRAARDSAGYRLGVLTGRAPAEGLAMVGDCAAPPVLEQALPVGDGAGLLARRPDVRQAEQRLAGAAARVGVAMADLYPRVTLGGSVGATATGIGGLGDSDAFRFDVGPLVSWSFPNMQAARARLEAAEAGSDAALAQFRQTMLIALQEAETALSVYANRLDRVAALRRAQGAAAEAARISRLRYDRGAENFLSVLDAERTLAETDATLARAEALIASDQVNVFRALGGGWARPAPR